MPEEYDNDLLKEGILHFQSKEYALARRYFERALDAADDLADPGTGQLLPESG